MQRVKDLRLLSGIYRISSRVTLKLNLPCLLLAESGRSFCWFLDELNVRYWGKQTL